MNVQKFTKQMRMVNKDLLDNVLEQEIQTVYCDMDGVLFDAWSKPENVKHYKDEDFFKGLKPIERNVEAVKIMLEFGAKVKIISTTPDERADRDKRHSLKLVLPEIKDEDIIFVREGREKTEYIKNTILIAGRRNIIHSNIS